MMDNAKIEVRKEPAPSNSRVDVSARPFVASINGVSMVDVRGRVRRFSTRLLAQEAAVVEVRRMSALGVTSMEELRRRYG